MKKYLFYALTFFSVNMSFAQNVEHKSFLIYLYPGVKDTVMWPLRDTFGAVKWRGHYNPPDNSNYSGSHRFTIKKVSTPGTGPDSVAILEKPLDQDGNFYVSVTTAELDTFWLFQSTSFSDLKYVGSGENYTTPSIDKHYPLINLAFIIQTDTIGLAVGDSALFRIGVTKDK